MRIAIRIVLLLGFSFALSGPAQSEAIRTVALSGQHAPGTVGNVRFAGFGDEPMLNANGQVLFNATLSGDGICCNFFTGGRWNNAGLWTGEAGSLALVARAGDQVAGFPAGVRYGGPFNFSNLSFSSSGQFSFQAGIVGPGFDSSNDFGVWSGTAGSTNVVFREGDHAPGTLPEFVFNSFDGPSNFKINSSGQSALAARLISTLSYDPNDDGIWSTRTGPLALVARVREHAPGMPADVQFDGLDRPSLNTSGYMAFSAGLSGSGIVYGHNRSIWSDRSGTLAAIARADDPAPGLASGIVFAGLGNEPKLDAAGHIAFNGYLSGPGVTEANNSGIWSDINGPLSVILRAGDHAPGTPAGVNFNSLGDPDVLFNGAGKMAFAAGLTGASVNPTNYYGVWSNASGPFQLVARQGDPAPGVSGKVFGSVGELMLNDAGQVAFYSSLTDPGNSGSFGGIDSLWVEDKAGALRLIVRDGGQIEVSPGDFRTVESFEYVRGGIDGINGDGSPSAFNGRGQFVFAAVFTNNTNGIFISDVGTVPEPASGALIFTLGLFLAVPLLRKRK